MFKIIKIIYYEKLISVFSLKHFENEKIRAIKNLNEVLNKATAEIKKNKTACLIEKFASKTIELKIDLGDFITTEEHEKYVQKRESIGYFQKRVNSLSKEIIQKKRKVRLCTKMIEFKKEQMELNRKRRLLKKISYELKENFIEATSNIAV